MLGLAVESFVCPTAIIGYIPTKNCQSCSKNNLKNEASSGDNYASVNSTCAQAPTPPPPPPPGNCGAFARLVSPGDGAFADVALPGGRAFANPQVNPELLTCTRFPIRI